MGTIALFTFLGTAAFCVNTRNWKGLFVVLTAGISGLLVLDHLDGKSEQFVSNVFLLTVMLTGSVAAIICRIVFGPPSYTETRELPQAPSTSFEFRDDFPDEMPNGKYLNSDIDDAVPNVPGDPSVNTVWPNVQ